MYLTYKNKKMKTNILLIGLLISGSICSQVIKQNLPPRTFYKNAVVSVYESTPRHVSKVEIKSDSISFIDYDAEGVETNYSLPFTSIDYLQVKEGNNALNGAIVGGLIVLSMGACTLIDNKYYKNFIPEMLVLTVGGASVGGLIGLLSSKKKKFFISY